MSEPVVQVVPVAEMRIGPGFLPAPESDRMRRLVHAEDRRAYLAAHILVRRVAAELLGIAPADADAGANALRLVHSCPSCGGTDHGRPSIAGHPGAHVSLSHARGVVAAIAATTPCGIDVENHRAGVVPAGALTAREQSWLDEQPDSAAAFTRLWARKEAWVKATGGSLERAATLDVLEARWVTGEMHTEEYAAAWVVL